MTGTTVYPIVTLASLDLLFRALLTSVDAPPLTHYCQTMKDAIETWQQQVL